MGYAVVSRDLEGLKCTGCLRRFGGPNRKMRSIFRADKMWRRFCVGMSVAIDLAKPEPEPPTGDEA
jgi:hypothetical protein